MKATIATKPHRQKVKATSDKRRAESEPAAQAMPDTRPRCARCDVAAGAVGWRDKSGAFHEVEPEPLLARGLRLPCDVFTRAGVVHVVRVALVASPAGALCRACHIRHVSSRRPRGRAAAERHAAMQTADLFG